MESWWGHRLQRIESTKAAQAGHVADPEHFQFRIACSCPPDKRIHMRGGLMYNANTRDGWFVESTTIDLTNDSQVGLIFNFDNANYYLSCYVRLTDGGSSAPYTFGIVGDGVEYATSGEAEQALIDYAELGFAWGSAYPLCGIILRNDGNALTDHAFLPIDPINRGRSYLWPRDWRPRNIAL